MPLSVQLPVSVPEEHLWYSSPIPNNPVLVADKCFGTDMDWQYSQIEQSHLVVDDSFWTGIGYSYVRTEQSHSIANGSFGLDICYLYPKTEHFKDGGDKVYI
jgi:hypothetical protein